MSREIFFYEEITVYSYIHENSVAVRVLCCKQGYGREWNYSCGMSVVTEAVTAKP